jgi:hypothetical protein
MKYLALTIGIVGILPHTLFLRGKPSARNQLWILVGLIPFTTRVVPFFDIALIINARKW